MSPEIVALVLLAALLHAAWNSMAKSGGTPVYSIASYHGVGALMCLPLLVVLPMPDMASWPMLLLSLAIHNAYYGSLSMCYRSGDLSQVYPLFRGLAPVLVAAGATFAVGEYLAPGAVLGIVLVSIGLLCIAMVGGSVGRIPRPALLWGLVTAVLIAGYTVTDGMGARVAGNPFSYIVWLFVLEPIPIGLWLLARDRNGWADYVSTKTVKVIGGALATILAYGAVIFAMTLAPLALVSSLRETSVIFAALIGALMFREPFGLKRAVAAVLVCAGVIMIKVLA